MWPQLRGILADYLNARATECPPRADRLLFPGAGARLAEFPRKTFAALLKRAGMAEQGITPRMLRHTYTAQRLQTLDAGSPISPYTVGRELGHSSAAMVQEVYGHLGTMRHRSEVVEFRTEAFPAVAERLAAHGFVTGIVTIAAAD